MLNYMEFLSFCLIVVKVINASFLKSVAQYFMKQNVILSPHFSCFTHSPTYPLVITTVQFSFIILNISGLIQTFILYFKNANEHIQCIFYLFFNKIWGTPCPDNT